METLRDEALLKCFKESCLKLNMLKTVVSELEETMYTQLDAMSNRMLIDAFLEAINVSYIINLVSPIEPPFKVKKNVGQYLETVRYLDEVVGLAVLTPSDNGPILDTIYFDLQSSVKYRTAPIRFNKSDMCKEIANMYITMYKND